MKKSNASILFAAYGAFVWIILATQIHHTAADYTSLSAPLCGPTAPNVSSCPGFGTSNPSDCIGYFLVGNEAIYLLLELPGIRDVYALLDSRYQWEPTIIGTMEMLSVVAFIYYVNGIVYSMSTNVNVCATLTSVANDNSQIDGIVFLTGAQIYDALKLYSVSYTAACNTFDTAFGISVPATPTSVGGRFTMDIASTTSFIIYETGRSAYQLESVIRQTCYGSLDIKTLDSCNVAVTQPYSIPVKCGNKPSLTNAATILSTTGKSVRELMQSGENGAGKLAAATIQVLDNEPIGYNSYLDYVIMTPNKVYIRSLGVAPTDLSSVLNILTIYK